MGYIWDYNARGDEDGGGVGDVDEGGDGDDVDDVDDVDDGDDSDDGDDGVCMMTKCTEVVVSCLAGLCDSRQYLVSFLSQVIGLEQGGAPPEKIWLSLFLYNCLLNSAVKTFQNRQTLAWHAKEQYCLEFCTIWIPIIDKYCFLQLKIYNLMWWRDRNNENCHYC